MRDAPDREAREPAIVDIHKIQIGREPLIKIRRYKKENFRFFSRFFFFFSLSFLLKLYRSHLVLFRYCSIEHVTSFFIIAACILFSSNSDSEISPWNFFFFFFLFNKRFAKIVVRLYRIFF